MSSSAHSNKIVNLLNIVPTYTSSLEECDGNFFYLNFIYL